MINKYCFMAFGKSNETKEFTGSFTKYEGFGISKVLAVNPTKAELEKILGREIANEPVYVDKDANGIDRVKLSFVMQTVPEKNNGIETITIGNLWLKKQTRVSQAGKTQMIDKYGNCKWLFKEDLNSPIDAFDNASARPTCNGEEEFIDFLRTLANIDRAIKYNKDTNTWSFIDGNLADCECRIDNMAKLFAGDVSEIRAALADVPNNTINALYYVSTTNGKEYQNVCLNKVATTYARNLNFIRDYVLDKQQSGGYPGVVFNFNDLHEYVVAPTDITVTGTVVGGTMPEPTDDLPWA